VVVGAALASVGATAFMVGRSDVVTPVVAPTQRPVVMTLSRTGTIFLGAREIARADLVPELDAAFERSGTHQLTVVIDRGLAQADARHILAATKRAGALSLNVTVD
jgi:biopolymer transport protein ExbD